MDIKQLETAPIHEDGREVCIKDESGNDTDFFIRVVGEDSHTWKRIIRKYQRGVINEALPEDMKDDGISERAEVIAQATMDWRGLESDGEPVKFTKKRCFDLYRNAPYILEQVDRFIGNRANFTKS